MVPSRVVVAAVAATAFTLIETQAAGGEAVVPSGQLSALYAQEVSPAIEYFPAAHSKQEENSTSGDI